MFPSARSRQIGRSAIPLEVDSNRLGWGRYRRDRTESCIEWGTYWRNSWEARGGTRCRAGVGRMIGAAQRRGRLRTVGENQGHR